MRDHAVVKGLQRAELAQRTGCNLETVRYYEKVGLLPEPPRTTSGYRSYDNSHERRLRFVLRARELGFSLDEIRELLRLVDERDQPCAEARAVANRSSRRRAGEDRRSETDGAGAEGRGRTVCRRHAPRMPLIETLFREGRSTDLPVAHR